MNYKFKCRQCGKCCSGEPGFVWVLREEIEQMASHLDITTESFMSSYVHKQFNKYSLKEKANGDCVFLGKKEGKALCLLYESRPEQCKTFPYWEYYTKSAENWQEVMKECPGCYEF